jgi:hypothetical protein
MVKMKKIIILMLVMIMLVPSIYATCTVTFDKEIYNPTETVEATMICNLASEKSQAYTLTWTNQTGAIVEIDTGTTPSERNTEFFRTYIIPSDYNSTYGNNIVATLTGTNLEGTDSANVSNTIGNRLVINNCKFKPKAFIGADFAINCQVNTINGKSVDNAECSVYSTDINGAPLQVAEYVSDSINGEFISSGILKPENMQESTSYLAELSCHCNSGDNKCWDHDGVALEDYQGSASIGFETSQWLTMNTYTLRKNFEARQVLTVCANITSIDSEERINTENYYKVWCGDSFTSSDRVVIASTPTNEPDRRGINPNQTLNHCWSLVVPEKRWLQGRTNNCLASAEVWVLNNEGKRIKLYTDRSESFNITIEDVGINPDWEITGNNHEILTSSVNMSSNKYSDWHAERIGNIDLRLDLNTPEYVDAYTDSVKDGILIFDDFLRVQNIKSINVTYCNGTSIESALEVTNDGYVEIEARNINLSNACIDAEVVFNIYKNREVEALEGIDNSSLNIERAADALEGIENKTGTFHFDVNCPTSTVGYSATCVITGYIEFGDVDKETDITCYVNDRKSLTNWNTKISSEPYVVSKEFDLREVTEGTATVTCQASYYNLGSRTDTFVDSFSFTYPKTSAPGTNYVEEDEDEGSVVADLLKDKKNIWIFIGIILVMIVFFPGDKEDKNKKEKNIKGLSYI